MRRLPIVLALASALGCDLQTGSERPVQSVQAPAGQAFADVRRSWYPLQRKTRCAVLLAITSHRHSAASDRYTALIGPVFEYESRIDADVQVRWADDDHLVISFRPQPAGVELIRKDREQGIAIDYERRSY
jgi:hypothetical protein